MCFHSSRFNARQTNETGFILYEQQDETLWDRDLINRGIYFLNRSAEGTEITSYHLEARIAFLHCQKEDTKEKWQEILQLYNQLLIVNYSPSVALNRTFALYKAHGKEAALTEAGELNLESNHFYFLLLAELYKSIDKTKAQINYHKAHFLAKTQTEKQSIQRKMDNLI